MGANSFVEQMRGLWIQAWAALIRSRDRVDGDRLVSLPRIPPDREPIGGYGRRRVMRFIVGVAVGVGVGVAVALAVTACSSGVGSRGDTPVPDTSVQPGAVDQSVVSEASGPDRGAVEVDVDDPRPVIATGYRWLSLSFPRSVDLPQFSIYPDGRVIGVELLGVPPLYRAYELELSPSRFQELLELAGAVGLVGGGLQPEVPLPEGIGVVDGGSYYFAVRSNGELTARVVEQPGESWFDGDETVPDRVAYLDFFRALLPLNDDLHRARLENRPQVRLDRGVIVSAPLDVDQRDSNRAWSGPDLDELDWQPIAGGSVCALIDNDEWPLDRAEQAAPLVIDGRLVSRRPLLPHEQDCDDVSELRLALGLDDPSLPEPVNNPTVHSTPRWTGGVDGPVIFGRSNEVAEEALASGTVQLRNGCLVLEAPGADNIVISSLIVWKYGATWVDVRSAIALGHTRSSEIELGEFVELGGGFHTIETLVGFVDDPAAILRVGKCLNDPTITGIFVNQ